MDRRCERLSKYVWIKYFSFVMIIAIFVQLAHIATISYTTNTYFILSQVLEYNGIRATFLDNKIVLIEFDEKYFYEYIRTICDHSI